MLMTISIESEIDRAAALLLALIICRTSLQVYKCKLLEVDSTL